MKLTKATLNRLNKKASGNDQLYIIADILLRSAVICGEPGKFEIVDRNDEYLTPAIFSDGKREFVSGTTRGSYQRRIVAGLAVKYPAFISGTFTNGLNGVEIYDVNRLVKSVFDNQPA